VRDMVPDGRTVRIALILVGIFGLAAGLLAEDIMDRIL
jgi:hypothetical protein